MTINDYRRKFLHFLQLRNMAVSTQDTYLNIITNFLLFAKRDPSTVSHQVIGEYILTLKSPKYKRQTWYTLNTFYNCIMQMQNYMAAIPKPKQDKYIPQTLNHSEVTRLIESITNLKQRAAITLIYACALRIGECVNLRIADIDGERKQIHITHAKGAKDRIIPITDNALQLLRQYYSAYRPTDYLFNGQNSPQYDVRSIQSVFHRAKMKAGIHKKVTVHSLRHSRATELLRNGMDASLIQKFLGHANIKTTTDFYLHTDITDLQFALLQADLRKAA